MSKKNKRQQPDPRIARYKPKEKSQEEPHFWTADGRKVRIKTISFFDVKEAEINIRAEYEERTKPPTYQTVTAGGVVRDHELTEKILVVDDDQPETERRQAAWAEYQKALAEMQGEISKATLSLIMEGINETPEDESWIATRKKRHLSIPPEDSDDEDRVLFWKTAVLLKNNVADILEAQTEIMTLSLSGMATREQIEAAEDTFRNQLPGEPEDGTDTIAEGDSDPSQEKDTP